MISTARSTTIHTTPSLPDPSPSSLLLSLSTWVLSFLFTLTGVGTAMLGATLPAFLAHWSLKDRDGGLLLFMAWLGAALGALLTQGSLAKSVGRGVVLVAITCFALIYANRISVFPLTFFYGLGLGITMTSISRLHSQRKSGRRTQEMNRLNLLWAFGALACPTLAARALFTSNTTYLFAFLGSMFALASFWVIPVEPQLHSVHYDQASSEGRHLPSVPAIFCGISALVVGVEASLGGWLTTYTKRTDHSIRGAVTATSAFWAGLLLSRALHSTPWLLQINAIHTLRAYSWLVALSLCLMAIAHQPVFLLTLALVLGFGLGPLYPLLLALVLPRFHGNRVFFFAGVGSAILPWFTGILSSRAGSLRTGLVVPCIAGCLLVLLMHWVSVHQKETWMMDGSSDLSRSPL